MQNRYTVFHAVLLGWMSRHEARILLGILIVYATLMFVAHGIVRVGFDNPAYTDPAINFVEGLGFTSTCWYAQGSKEFWAGNVPLHQFLLIPWLKLFGVSYKAVLLLNFLYVSAGTALIWLAAKKSGFIASPLYRIGAITFILLSDSAYNLLSTGRYDALGFLLVAFTAYLFSTRRQGIRFSGLFIVAALIPWAHLAVVSYTATLGALIMVFYPKRFCREIVSFGFGGAIGTLALFAFFQYHDVWNEFYKSITPSIHVEALEENAAWQAHRHGGLTQPFFIPCLYLTAAGMLIAGIIRKEWRFPLFAVCCMVTIPVTLLATGVFSVHYGWMLLFMATMFIFAGLSRETSLAPYSIHLMVLLTIAGIAVPASFARKIVKNRLMIIEQGDPQAKLAVLARESLRPDDVAWVSEELYYEAKPLVCKVHSSPVVFADFGGAITYPGRKEELGSITVCIFRQDPNIKDANRFRLELLPGQWDSTGQAVAAWGSSFVVYRRNQGL